MTSQRDFRVVFKRKGASFLSHFKSTNVFVPHSQDRHVHKKDESLLITAPYIPFCAFSAIFYVDESILKLWKTWEARVSLIVNVTFIDGFVNVTSFGQTVSCHHSLKSDDRLSSIGC